MRSSLNLTSRTDLAVMRTLERQSPRKVQLTWVELAGLMLLPKALITVLKDLKGKKKEKKQKNMKNQSVHLQPKI